MSATTKTDPASATNRFDGIDGIIEAARAGETVRLLCLDTETTGVTDSDHITQFSATMITLSSPADAAALLAGDIESVVSERYDAFCKPPIPICARAAEVTGITDEFVSSFPSFADGILADAQRLVDAADVLIGHNVGFDIKKLRHDGVDVPADKLIEDTMFDFRDMCKCRWGDTRARKNLTAAVGLFGYTFDAHDSANDVEATLFLFSHLLRSEEHCARSADEIVRMHDIHTRRVQAYLRRFARPDAEATRAA